MTVDEVLARARSQLGLGTVYRLGGGKIVPVGDDCRDELGSCDCSAFVCWVLKMRKYQGEELWWLAALNGGWFNTDGIWIDARGDGMRPEPAGPLTTGCFSQIPDPRPGAVAVYPARWISRTPGPDVGHISIVTEVEDPVRWRAIHCSASNYRIHRDAIQETGPEAFIDRKALQFAWPASVKP